MQNFHLGLYVIHITFALTIYLFTRNTIPEEETSKMIFFVASILCVGVVYWNNILTKKELPFVLEAKTLDSKIEKYKTYINRKLISTSIVTIVITLIYYFSSNSFFLGLAMIMIAYLFILRPTSRRIKEDLSLTDEDMA